MSRAGGIAEMAYASNQGCMHLRDGGGGSGGGGEGGASHGGLA